MKTLDRLQKEYKIISPYEFAQKIEQTPHGEQIEFYVDDLMHMDDFKSPQQKHYVTITYLDHYPNIIAGKDQGGFTFIKNVSDYIYSPWGLGKFVRDYLAAYNERFNDNVCRIVIDCQRDNENKKHRFFRTA